MYGPSLKYSAKNNLFVAVSSTNPDALIFGAAVNVKMNPAPAVGPTADDSALFAEKYGTLHADRFMVRLPYPPPERY